MNQGFSYETRRRGYPENHNLADLALFDLLLDSLLHEFNFAGTTSNAFVRAPTRWQERLDYTSFSRAQAPRVPLWPKTRCLSSSRNSLSRRTRRRCGLLSRPRSRARAGASKPARTSAPSTPAVGSTCLPFALSQMRRATPLLIPLIRRSAGSTPEDVSYGYASGKAAAK